MILKSQSNINNYENGLYLVSTPLGNLKDITFRAIDTLKNSDFILCEDTRVSKKLLDKYQIKSKLISNHKFIERTNVFKIIEHLKSGKIISLISDAGTPGISDPGAIMVNECIDNNIKVFPIPGPSAVVTAVSASGFSDNFLFYGFFPDKRNLLISELKKLSELENTLVFFSSPKKINKIIPELKKNFSGRKIVFCREITKLYEEFIRTDINKLKVFDKELKGELTVVISEKKNIKNNSQKLSESDMYIIGKMINKFTTKEISDIISYKSNISKKEIYNYCLKLKNEK